MRWSPERFARLRRILMVGALLAVLALSIYVVSTPAALEELATYGYVGVFLIQFLSTSSIAFPTPGFVAVVAAGAVLDPFVVGIAGGLGTTAGESIAYLAGYTGSDLVDPRRLMWAERLRPLLQRYGFIIYLSLATIPNPVLFDVVGVSGGLLRYRFSHFLVAVTIGSIIKNLMYAYFGQLLQGWLRWV